MNTRRILIVLAVTLGIVGFTMPWIAESPYWARPSKNAAHAPVKQTVRPQPLPGS